MLGEGVVMFALFLLVQAVSVPQNPSDAGAIYRGPQRLEVPNEIAPAVVPYLQCIMQSTNTLLKGAAVSTGDAFRAVQARAVSECSSARIAARSRALEMLSTSAKPEADREAFVDNALNSIEHIQDKDAETLDRHKAR